MPGRGGEIEGGLKKGLGKLTGDEGLEAEGAAQQTAGKAGRKAGGAAREGKGSIKDVVGDAINSPTLEAEGKADRVRGKADRS